MRTTIVIASIVTCNLFWACSKQAAQNPGAQNPGFTGAGGSPGATAAGPASNGSSPGGTSPGATAGGSNATPGGTSTAGQGGGSTKSDAGGMPAAMNGGMPAADSGTAGPPPDETCTKQVPSSTDCSAPLAPGDRRSCMVGGRMYEVYAGKTLDLCKPTALVIDAHGATETAVQQVGEMQFCASGNICWMGLGSGWKAEADQPGGGFIAVFPQGVNNMWSQSDADFMVQLVGEIQKVADIDPKKVYISGISNGGALTYWTGCPHSDLFHGMSPNSGGSTCTSIAQPIPVIAFDDEPDFAYQGSVDAANAMVMLNKCTGAAKPWVTVDAMYDEAVCRSAKNDPMATLVPCNKVSMMIEPTTCQVWDQCDGGVKVVFCKVAANTEHGSANASLDGHIIYENNTLLNTPSLAWRFFKSFW